jgi:hypothetical protein
MKMLALLLTAILAFTGCAGLQATKAQVQGDAAKGAAALASFTNADLDQAIALATAAPDAEAPYRARCYATLKKHVPDGSTVGQALPAIKGLVSGFEVAAELDQKLRSGSKGPAIPADVHADCAVIVTSIEQFLIRIDALAAGAAMGAPGIGSGLSGAAGALPGILNAIPKSLVP